MAVCVERRRVKIGTSRNYFIGIIIIIFGIAILLDNLDVIQSVVNLVLPLILLVIGFKLYHGKKKIAGGILLGIGSVIFLNSVLGIEVGGLILPLLMMYIGYRFIRGKKKEVEVSSPEQGLDQSQGESKTQKNEDPLDAWEGELDELTRSKGQKTAKPLEEESAHEEGVAEVKSSLLGDFFLTEGRFELKNMHIRHGIGDIKIDLSKAMMENKETFIVIHGWVGDIDIFVPYDLDVSVSAAVTIGDLEVLGHKQGGINRKITLATRDYGKQTRKVRIVLSLFIGDIDVRYV